MSGASSGDPAFLEDHRHARGRPVADHRARSARQSSSQLVSEAVGAPQLAMAHALFERAAGRVEIELREPDVDKFTELARRQRSAASLSARHGVRALLFDLRCFGHSSCPGGRGHATADVAAAMAELRRRGAHRVALVGASTGGAIAVVAAARLHPGAVVDLSGERDTTGLTPGIDADAGAAAHGVTAPALFAVARGDRYVPVADMRAVARGVRSATKRVIVLPAAAGHGCDMVFGTATTWSPLAATVAAFIRRHAGARRG